MSFEAVSWAYSIEEGTSLDVFLLVTLGSFADENGIAWPAQSTLADRCRATVRAVNRCLQRMEDAGYLIAVPVTAAIETHKELLGDNVPSRNFKAWTKGADRRSVCYVLNLGRFAWQKVQDRRSITSGAPLSPISDEIMDSNDTTDGPRVLLDSNNLQTNLQASPDGSAGEGQPSDAAETSDDPAAAAKPPKPFANAVWKTHEAEMIRAFGVALFDTTIDSATPHHDDGETLTLAVVDQNAIDALEPHLPKLVAVLDRRIEFVLNPRAVTWAKERLERRVAARVGDGPGRARILWDQRAEALQLAIAEADAAAADAASKIGVWIGSLRPLSDDGETLRLAVNSRLERDRLCALALPILETVLDRKIDIAIAPRAATPSTATYTPGVHIPGVKR